MRNLHKIHTVNTINRLTSTKATCDRITSAHLKTDIVYFCIHKTVFYNMHVHYLKHYLKQLILLWEKIRLECHGYRTKTE